MAKRDKPKRVYARRRAERDADDARPYATRWWRAETDEACAGAAWLWVDRLRQRWAWDHLVDLIHEAIYEGRPLGTSVEAPAMGYLRQQRSAPATLNITRSMVDTATARLCKRRPMPVIGADDAGWTEKLFAKRTSRVLRRKLGQPHIERMKPDVIRDALIRGTGIAKVVRIGGDVTVERTPRHELVVDPREARYNHPRCLAQVKPYPREVLCEEFPEYEEQIEAAATFEQMDQWTMYNYDGPGYVDHVEVAELWHLPSGPNADDGEHIITLRGCVLLREKWNRPRFPFARMHWSAPIRGWMGHGLVEDLVGVQAKVNDIARDIQEALYYGAMLKIFAQRGSNVNKNHLRARHPVVIEHDGNAPQFVAPNPVAPQQIQFLEWLIQKAYEISGISQMSASSKNPLGSNASGKALDTMYDIESDRFAQVETGYAMFICDLGTLMIDEARDMVSEASERKGDSDSDLKKADLAKWIRDIDWKKVDIDAGDYHLGVEHNNFLPDSRAGKLAFVKEMASAGLIPDPSMTASLFDEPDIARMNRWTLGPVRNLERVMEGLADPKVAMLDIAPDEYMNLKLGILMAKGELEDAASLGADETVLERYRQWIGLAKDADSTATSGANMSPSLPGMPTGAGMPAMPTAGSLQPGLGGGGPPMAGPPGMPPMPQGAPTGMAA